jgi:hypothetical protein
MSRGFSFGENQTLECLLLALSGHSLSLKICPLSDNNGQRWILARDGDGKPAKMSAQRAALERLFDSQPLLSLTD